MVPNGWEKHPVGKICRSIVPGRNKPKEFSGSIPWVTTPEIKGRYIPSKVQHNYVSNEALKECGGKIVPSGAVIMAAVGELGLVAIASEEVVLNQQLHAFVCSALVHNEYLAYWLSSQKPYMETIASKTTIPYLNKTNCESIPVALPPLPEQRKIAKILCTWDKAISTTERLIDNSKQQKKALMQQLLTGKKRLLDDSGKPFESEWVIKKLSDLFTFSTASSKSKFIDSEGENYILDMGSVSTSGKLIPTKKTKISKDFLSKGQLVMPKDDIGGGQIIGRVGFVDSPEKYVLSDHVYCLTPKSDCSLFLSYLINHHDVNKGLRRRANGTAQLGLGKKDAEKQPVFMPKDITEQQKIASVLINADQEIELLEQQLADLKQEKKALMQQLLTGKRRVKVDDKEVA
ncbi:MAG: restriction endonuclease subunit S [Pseudomonadota bacterium]|nr:restriction endonuclease subunit S [Pseudomonadota bacterium]